MVRPVFTVRQFNKFVLHSKALTMTHPAPQSNFFMTSPLLNFKFLLLPESKKAIKESVLRIRAPRFEQGLGLRERSKSGRGVFGLHDDYSYKGKKDTFPG
jgi:hypothetical protein